MTRLALESVRYAIADNIDAGGVREVSNSLTAPRHTRRAWSGPVRDADARNHDEHRRAPSTRITRARGHRECLLTAHVGTPLSTAQEKAARRAVLCRSVAGVFWRHRHMRRAFGARRGTHIGRDCGLWRRIQAVSLRRSHACDRAITGHEQGRCAPAAPVCKDTRRCAALGERLLQLEAPHSVGQLCF